MQKLLARMQQRERERKMEKKKKRRQHMNVLKSCVLIIERIQYRHIE